MSQPKPSNRVELKYCESCGCLLTRAVGSGVVFCTLCESKLSESERYLTHPKKRTPRPARLPKRGASDGIDLQACADTGANPDLETCA